MLHPQLVSVCKDIFPYLGSETEFEYVCLRLTKRKSRLSVILLLNYNFCLFQNHMLTLQSSTELEPITDNYIQADEVDMGVTYDELSVYGRLRKINKLGPWGMWEKLLHLWGDSLSPQQIYEKVKFFHWNYAINRHKQTTITPAYHMEAYG
jgi:NH3-dependent NAD+ synthetase